MAGDCDCAREIGEGVTCDDVVEVGHVVHKDGGTCEVCDGVEGVCVTCEGVLQARVVCREREVMSGALRSGTVRDEEYRREVEMLTRRGEGEEEATVGPSSDLVGVLLSPREVLPPCLPASLVTTPPCSMEFLDSLLVSDLLAAVPVPFLLPLLPLSPLRRKSHTCSFSPSSSPTVTLSHPNTSPEVKGSLLKMSEGSQLLRGSWR